MSFFISNAYAQAPAPAGPGLVGNFIMIGVLFFVFYVLLIRPQQKRQKEHRKMLDALSKGDEVVTNGGLLGKVTNVGDNFISMEIAEGQEVKVQRGSVAALMPKGTMKAS